MEKANKYRYFPDPYEVETKMETTSFPIPNKPENYEEINKLVDASGGVYRGLRVDSKSTEVDFYESIGIKTNPAEVRNIITEGTQCTVETLEGNRVGDCAKEGENEACGVNLSVRFGGKELAEWCRGRDYSCTECALKCENNQTTGYGLSAIDPLAEPEPEPPWQDTECNDPMFIQDQEIETQWTRVKTSLKILRNLYIERANEEFLRRAKMLMEVD